MCDIFFYKKPSSNKSTDEMKDVAKKISGDNKDASKKACKPPSVCPNMGGKGVTLTLNINTNDNKEKPKVLMKS